MRRAAQLLVALFVCGNANAAITFVDDNNDDGAASTSSTVTEPTGATENDLVVCIASTSEEDGTWDGPNDMTVIDSSIEDAVSASEGEIGLWYKVRGSTAGDALTFTYSGTGASLRAVCGAYRGVNTSNPIDVAFVEATHFNVGDNAANTAAQPITTVTNGAWVILYEVLSGDSLTTAGAPSGYTARFSEVGTGNSGRQFISATKEIATAGTETPGAWTSSVTLTDDARNITLAIRPAGAGGSDRRRRLLRN